MAITLPTRSAGSDPGKRGVRLPTAADVPQIAQPRDPGVQFPRNTMSNPVGAGFEKVADALAAVADRQRKLQDATAITEGKIEYSGAGMEEFRRRQVEDDPSRPDYMTDFDSFLREKEQTILESRSGSMSKEAQERLRLTMLESRQAMVDSAGRLQLEGMQKKAGDAIQTSINTWSAQAQRDPAFLDVFLGIADEGLAEFKGAMTPDQERDARSKARQTIITSALGGMIDQKQFDKVEEMMKSGRFDEDLLPNARDGVLAAVDRGRKEAASALRAEVKLQLDDEIASIRETGAGIGLSKDRIRAAYPDQADKIFQTLSEERAFYKARSTVQLNSPEEDQRLLASLQPQGEGFKVEAERRDAVLKALDAKYKAIAKDPAGYAMMASPDVRNAFTVAEKEPAAMPRALALLDETQARLGVPPHLRGVLSESDAKAQVQVLTLGSAEAGADRIQAMAERYGEFWPRAYRDMVQANLPSSYRVLATVDNPVARKSLGEALRTEAQQKGSLRKGVGEDAKTIDDNVTQALGEFRSTLAYAPDGSMIAGDMEEGAKLLAYRYRSTMSASEAATRAVDDMVGKYSFIQDSQHNARVPKDMARQVEDTADRLLAGLTAADMRDPGGNPDLSVARRQEIMFGAAKRGIWITNESDDGWLRLDVNQQPVMRLDGTRLEFKFSDPPLEGPRPTLDPTSERARRRGTIDSIQGTPAERSIKVE